MRITLSTPVSLCRGGMGGFRVVAGMVGAFDGTGLSSFVPLMSALRLGGGFVLLTEEGTTAGVTFARSPGAAVPVLLPNRCFFHSCHACARASSGALTVCWSSPACRFALASARALSRVLG